MTNVILASQSPRRQELLRLMGVDFETIPSGFVAVKKLPVAPLAPPSRTSLRHMGYLPG